MCVNSSCCREPRNHDSDDKQVTKAEQTMVAFLMLPTGQKTRHNDSDSAEPPKWAHGLSSEEQHRKQGRPDGSAAVVDLRLTGGNVALPLQIYRVLGLVL